MKGERKYGITAAALMEVWLFVAIYSFFEERNKEGYVLSFGANERTKENIHP